MSEARYTTGPLRRAAMRLLAQETAGDPPTSENLAAASGRMPDEASSSA